MKIGFIGLGIMGSRMAANLARAGYTLSIYNRTRSKAESMAGGKVRVMDTPAMVARESSVIITMLSTPEAVQEAALGVDGLLAGMGKGSVWIDCSTVNPSFSRQMAEITEQLGFNFLDAPVTGSLDPAEKGELVFLVGGRKSIVKYCTPLFKTMGRKIIHAGDHGRGSGLKMVNNMVMGMSLYAVAEGILLGEAQGIGKEELLDLLDGSPIAPAMIAAKKGNWLNGDYTPEFPLQWMHKDLQLATQTAYENNVALPGANAVKEMFAMARSAGLGDKDFTAVYLFLAEVMEPIKKSQS